MAAEAPAAVQDIARDHRDEIAAEIGDLRRDDAIAGERRVDERVEAGDEAADHAEPDQLPQYALMPFDQLLHFRPLRPRLPFEAERLMPGMGLEKKRNAYAG